MAYRYEPKSADVEKLAELLGSRLPQAAWQFQLDHKTGKLRVRGESGKGRDYRFYEQLLRDDHEPMVVVSTFENKLKYQPQLTG